MRTLKIEALNHVSLITASYYLRTRQDVYCTKETTRTKWLIDTQQQHIIHHTSYINSITTINKIY